MTAAWRILGPAQEETDAAVAWYEEQRPTLGMELLDERDAALAIALEHPEMGAPVATVDGRVVRRVLLRRFPYALVMVHEGGVTTVVAMAHLHREPGYWRSRLDPR